MTAGSSEDGLPGAPADWSENVPGDEASPAAGSGQGAGSPAVAQEAAPAAPAVKYSREWVVSPKGNDAASGAPGAPFRTISKALSVVGPGERITVQAGTYAERILIDGAVRAGTKAAPIRLQGEGMPKIVPGSSDSTMVAIRKPYWQMDGFEVDAQKAAKFAVAFAGTTTGSVLSGSNLHDGALGAGVATYDNARDVTIEGNHIHHFSRGDKDSHGVVIQPTSRNITVRNNRIHDNSGDSVQCIGPEGFSKLPPADGVLLEGNDMYSNRENAVDIKTCYNVTIRNNRMHDFVAALPGGCAAVVHYSARDVTFQDNEIFNVGKAIAVGGNHEGPSPTRVKILGNLIRNVVKGNQLDGIAIRLENSIAAEVVDNTMLKVQAVGVMAGGGTGGDTSNLKVRDNVIEAPQPVAIGAHAPGLALGTNVAPGGAVATATSVAQSLVSYEADPSGPPTDGTALPGLNGEAASF